MLNWQASPCRSSHSMITAADGHALVANDTAAWDHSRLKASRRRPCRSSTRRQAYRAYARSCEPPRQRGAALGPPPPRTTAVVVSSEPPWTLLHQRRAKPGIVVDRPGVRQRPVYCLEVEPTAFETPEHVGFCHVVATLPHTRRDAVQGQLRRREAQEYELDAIPGLSPSPKAGGVASAAQRTLEREVNPARGQSVEFAEQQPAGRQRGQCRLKGRQPRSASHQVLPQPGRPLEGSPP
jgi:hypothetical protein